MQYIEEENSHLRHIVSYIYVFDTHEEAVSCKEEYIFNSTISITTGNIVHLLDSTKSPIIDRLGNLCEYQVVSVYRDSNRAGLVTSYGEYIGLYDIKDILYAEVGPLFKKEDYRVNTSVLWLDGEDVYEGIIDTLYDNTAKIINVKKLFPTDYTVRVPYWKIPESRNSCEESATSVIHTVIGDDID